MIKKQQTTVLDLPVEFGGVSIGESTCRLGVRISRDCLNIVAADEAFCGHRLSGEVILGQRDRQPGEKALIPDVAYKVSGTFDVKKIGISQTQVTTGLTFSLNDIDIAELAKFSKGSGRLLIFEVGTIPADAPQEHDEEEEDNTGKYHWEGEGEAWRLFPLNQMFKGAIIKSLIAAGLENMGLLADYTKTGKKLSEVPGIGPGKADVIVENVQVFWDNNPHFKM